MASPSDILIGTAGVYFVAAQLAAKGYHAAVTFGNAPSIDVLVGLSDGASTLSLQVKTSRWALRNRGRGKDKQPDHYEWDVGKKSAKLEWPNLFFVFVDLKLRKQVQVLPDFFVVPSRVVFDRFSKTKNLKRWRWHPKVESIEQYKNNWDILHNHLDKAAQLRIAGYQNAQPQEG